MGPGLVTAVAMLAHLVSAPQPFRPMVKVDFSAQPSTGLTSLAFPRAVATATPQVLCTMPMLRPSTNVDPKIVVEPARDIDYKIRVIEQAPCVERASR